MPRGTDEHLSSSVEHLQRAFTVDVITAVAVAKVAPTMPAARPIAVRRPLGLLAIYYVHPVHNRTGAPRHNNRLVFDVLVRFPAMVLPLIVNNTGRACRRGGRVGYRQKVSQGERPGATHLLMRGWG